MKKLQRLGLALLIVLLLNIGSVQAQDEPQTPTPEATEVVTEAAPVGEVTEAATVEPTAEATPDPVSDSDRLSFSWTVVSQIVLAIVGAFLAGGLTVGGGILLALRTILRSPLLSNMVEKLFLSQPPDRRQTVRGVIDSAKEIIEGADKLTDGVLETEAQG